MQSTTTNMITCEHCGKLHRAGTLVCDVCGTSLAAWPFIASAPLVEELGLDRLPADFDLSEELKALSGSLCPYCSQPNRPGATFCLHCGHTLDVVGTSAAPIVEHAPGPGPGVMVRAPGPGSLPVGTILRERYQIVRKVAQGGMGAVYEALDLEQPGTRWAIKEMAQAVLHPEERTQTLRDFMREAAILATLQHPNLPTFNGIFSESGKHYLIMEFIPGRTLEHIVSTTREFLPEGRVMGWARQLCDVLTYLHTQDPPIIYRDCKPGNIMLVDGSEQVKLIDFGIARFHRAGRPAEDAAFGTAGYSPPEQYGNGQTDQRADIYALAATLHHLLTGHDPGQNPFHWRSARSYNPHVSRRVDLALLHALELNPDARFQSVEAFRQALGLPAPMARTVVAPAAPATAPPVTERLAKPPVLPQVEPPVAPAAPAPPSAPPAVDKTVPVLSLSDSVVDLGPMGRKARAGQRVRVFNTGQGPLKGRLLANAPWIALNARQIDNEHTNLTIGARKQGLALGHFTWKVPNLVGLLLRRLWPLLAVLILITVFASGTLAATWITTRRPGGPGRAL